MKNHRIVALAGRAGSPLPAAIANERFRVHPGAHGVTRPTWSGYRIGLWCQIAIVLCLAMVGSVSAQAVRRYNIVSSPAGIFRNISGSTANGAVITSPTPDAASGDYRFAYWDIDGVPAVSSAGPALTVVRATADHDNLTLTAHYLPSNQDADIDGIPDWREWRELGTLAFDISDDPGHDGLSIGYDLARGYPLAIGSTFGGGGVFRTATGTLPYHDPAKVLAYHCRSVPTGLLVADGSIAAGKTVTTPNLYDVNQGFRLGYWTVNGVRIAGGNGYSPTKISVAVTNENMQVVAHFFDANADTDSDGILDWQEYRLFGSLAYSLSSDLDGDGWTVGAAMARGYPPNFANTQIEGGVFQTASASVTFHNPGAVCSYTVTSDPAGYYSASGQAAAGTDITLPNLDGVVQGNQFACWLVDGQPFAGPDGACPSSIKVVLTHDNMQILAKYLPQNLDADVDGIPDWMEWWKFGGLKYDQASVPLSDRFSIGYKLARGYPLTIPDVMAEGGLSRSASGTIAYHDTAMKFRYAVSSDPAGLIADAATVVSNTVYTSPNLFGTLQGYTFTHWTVDGAWQNGPNGSAQTQIIRAIDHDNIQFVAHFLHMAQDNDNDGISDWFELRYFGDLFQNNDTSADNDSFNNGVKIARGYPVTIPNALVEGGVFRTGSASLAYHDPAKLMVYQISSDPAGLQNQSAMVAAGTVITTANLYGDTQGYTFAGWTVNGVRQAGPDGAAQTRISVTLNQDGMQIVAHYIPTSQDVDADGLPDWWEQFYFGTLANGGTNDLNGDSFTIAAERTRGYSSVVANICAEGGVFRTAAKTLTYHDSDIYKVYEFASDPSGLFYETRIVSPGTLVLTPNKYEDVQGYRFAYWTVNGSRQTGPTGVSQTRVAVTVNADMQIVGHYLPDTQDADADGIADWWEWFYLGTTNYGPASQLDGDGFSLGAKITRGYSPGTPVILTEGGVFRTASQTVRWHNPDVYATYILRSEPEGLLTTVEGMVTPGSTVMTPLLHGSTQGYTFAYWTVNGVFQASLTGAATPRVSVAISAATEIVAHYFPANADADNDGILDAYEWAEFGGLQYGTSSNLLDDGWTIGQKIARGFEPTVTNRMVQGGVFRVGSQTLSVQLSAYDVYHTVTTAVDPVGAGQVYGSGSYKQGSDARLTAVAALGTRNVFSHWSGGLTGQLNPSFVRIYAPVVVTAHFVELPPSIVTNNSNFGFRNGVFGFDVSGSSGQIAMIEGSTDLAVWIPLQTNVLGKSALYFSDPHWTNYPSRFYRLHSP